jgi:hypothetical protein
MLISASDLPGTGWVQRAERVFRLGKLGVRTPWGERAGKAGHFAAVRSFEQVLTMSWVVSQVFPFVSVEDASSFIKNWSMDNMWKNSKFQGEIVGERELLDPLVPQVDAVRMILQETRTPTQRGYKLYTYAAVGSVVLFVGVSRTDNPVTMEDVLPVITVQAAKLSA